jgi:hypothetical protein
MRKRSLEPSWEHSGLPPPDPAAYGLSPPLFQPLTAYATRGNVALVLRSHRSDSQADGPEALAQRARSLAGWSWFVEADPV